MKIASMLRRLRTTAFVVVAVCVFSSVVISWTMRQFPSRALALQPQATCIASFTTYYGDSSPNRKHNVALAAKFIDGTVVIPEEEFSFNDVVGARTEERGFKTAYIINDGEFVEGVGGGVCQVSSTLYNCALLADLYITCVHPHSLPVTYVAPSFDAMVSSASDLRFANTLSAPVTVKMTADGKYLRAEIYGVPSGAKIRRRSVETGILPRDTEYVDDATLPAGEEIVEMLGKDGLKSEGYLEYFAGGTLLRTVLIRRDSYKPQLRVIRRGTAPAITEEDVSPTPAEGESKSGNTAVPPDNFPSGTALPPANGLSVSPAPLAPATD